VVSSGVRSRTVLVRAHGKYVNHDDTRARSRFEGGKALHQARGFGSFRLWIRRKGNLRPNSDIDMAVSGLPARVYFSAITQASDLIGRPVDLVDLDDDTGLVRYLRGSGELVRVA